MRRRRFGMQRFLRREEGGMVVEFAILVPLFLILVFGIVDFGHAFYMKHVITNASREGARYGVKFQTDDLGKHIVPNALVPSIVNYVKNSSATNGGKGGLDLVATLPSNAETTVTPGGPGYTSGLAGDDVTVTIQARKYWFVLNLLIPGFGSYRDIQVTTDMKVE